MPGIEDWINSPLDIVQRFYGRPAKGFGELGPVTNSALLPWRIRTTCLENSAL